MRIPTATLRSVRSRITVRRVRKIDQFVAIVAWVSAMFGTLLFGGVNDAIFTVILVGAVAFTVLVTGRFW